MAIMFLRATTRKKNGKEHRYWSVVENKRCAGDKMVQHQVLYLGEINDQQEAAWRKTIEIFEDGQPPRPALKSAAARGDGAQAGPAVAVVARQKRREGAVARPRLAPRPAPRFAVQEPTHQTQDRRRHRMAHAAAVFVADRVQRAMGAVLDAPVGSRQFQQPLGAGLLGAQAAHQPDGFGFNLPVFEVSFPIHAGQLQSVRESHLGRVHAPHGERAPFAAPGVVFDHHDGRGERPPAGGCGLV